MAHYDKGSYFLNKFLIFTINYFDNFILQTKWSSQKLLLQLFVNHFKISIPITRFPIPAFFIKTILSSALIDTVRTQALMLLL